MNTLQRLDLGRIDLHTHTSLSDSPLTPMELFAQARRLGLQWLAVADHDTTLALPACVETAAALGIGFVPAVEITSAVPKDETSPVHILGYGLTPEGAMRLDAALAPVRQARTEGYRRAVESLRAMGYEVTWEQVLDHALGTGVHKVHIMHALARAGYATRFKGALYQSLRAPGGPLYGSNAFEGPAEAIRLIHEAGGVAVLAHPGIGGALDACDGLVELGLDGIEAYHPSHDPRIVEGALESARRHRLVVTGGSDYHGIYSDYDASLGCPRLTVAHVEALLERIQIKRESLLSLRATAS